MIRITKPYKDDLLMPVCLAYTNNELTIDVYQEYLDVAKEFTERFNSDYFSKEALEYLSNSIKISGYERLDDIYEFYYLFATDKKQKVMLDSVIDVYEAEFNIDNTDFEVEEIIKQRQPASVIVEDKMIAAIASSNYFIEDDDTEVELAVETIPAFRERGYGKAVLCDMVNKVIDMNKIPTYRVSCFNKASISTAKSCGFVEIGKEYYLNYYKEEE